MWGRLNGNGNDNDNDKKINVKVFQRFSHSAKDLLQEQ